MSAAEVAEGDGPRIEYWDAEEGVAWMVCEPVLPVHEVPAQRLAALLDRIADARGAAILCCGNTTFYECGANGRHIRAMEADQTVYLDAAGGRAMRLPPVVLGSAAPPDVVLEVDHTTDVRARKLDEYERWRFPEVWVEVPEPWQERRSRRRPGLTIHVLDTETGRYLEASASQALPDWTAKEIHLALNEPKRSAATWTALARVGRALGRQEGTRPTGDPLLQGLLQEVREEGRTEERVATVRQVLAERGIACSTGFLVGPEATRQLAALTPAQVAAAAFACRSETDFLSLLGGA